MLYFVGGMENDIIDDYGCVSSKEQLRFRTYICPSIFRRQCILFNMKGVIR